VVAEHLKVLLEDRKNGKMLATKLEVQLFKEITEAEFFIDMSKISSLNEI
jgi:hypothetical protein